MDVGDKVAISSPSRWPDGTSVYVEGEVVELRNDGKVVVVRDIEGRDYYAKRHVVVPREAPPEEE